MKDQFKKIGIFLSSKILNVVYSTQRKKQSEEAFMIDNYTFKSSATGTLLDNVWGGIVDH